MTRVPPIVFVVGALAALVVALIGLALGWPEVTPVAFFAFVFCTILATINIYLATMEPYVPPTVEVVSHVAAPGDSEQQDGGVAADARHMEVIEVAHDDPTDRDVTDDDPRRPA